MQATPVRSGQVHSPNYSKNINRSIRPNENQKPLASSANDHISPPQKYGDPSTYSNLKDVKRRSILGISIDSQERCDRIINEATTAIRKNDSRAVLLSFVESTLGAKNLRLKQHQTSVVNPKALVYRSNAMAYEKAASQCEAYLTNHRNDADIQIKGADIQDIKSMPIFQLSNKVDRLRQKG